MRPEGLDTMREMVAFRAKVPLEALTVIMYVPVEVEVVVERVSVDVVDSPDARTRLVWLSEIAGPDGEDVAVMVMFPEKPLRLCRRSCVELLPPAATVSWADPADILKSGRGFTLTRTIVLWMSVPLAPVMVTLKPPWDVPETVRVELFEPVTLVGLSTAFTEGSEVVAESSTAPVNPSRLETVMVEFPEPFSSKLTVVGAAAIAKS